MGNNEKLADGVYFNNVGSIVNDDGAIVYHFDTLIIKNGEETGHQNGQSVIGADGDSVEVTFRKLADDTCELFINGESIGFGALDGGEGMTPAQLEHSASTPEADADIVPEQ